MYPWVIEVSLVELCHNVVSTLLCFLYKVLFLHEKGTDISIIILWKWNNNIVAQQIS